jgi:acetyl esterase/lipase
MTGDLNSDDLMCRIVAEHAPSIVVNIDYRLTPEHRMPTQLEDCLKVYKWVSRDMVGESSHPEIDPKTGTTERGFVWW